MTAGRVGTSGLEAPHRGVRDSRRALLGSAVVIAGLMVVLVAPGMVATSGRQPATLPPRDPAVAAPAVAAQVATPPAVAVPAVAPSATAEWPVPVVPRVSATAGPSRPADRSPGRLWPGRSWGVYVD